MTIEEIKDEFITIFKVIYTKTPRPDLSRELALSNYLRALVLRYTGSAETLMCTSGQENPKCKV